jgi:hypothetical protein
MFIDPENAQISVSASDLNVAVVGAIPLIERFREHRSDAHRNEVSRAWAVRDGWHVALSY